MCVCVCDYGETGKNVLSDDGDTFINEIGTLWDHGSKYPVGQDPDCGGAHMNPHVKIHRTVWRIVNGAIW